MQEWKPDGNEVPDIYLRKAVFGCPIFGGH